MYNFVLWMSVLVYVFVVHKFVRMTFNIISGFRHAHLFTNEYPDCFWFSSCTFLYKWLSYSFGFSWCKYLYEWLFILVWVFVMHIFVRMTIHIILDFHHSHFCTNDYSAPDGWDQLSQKTFFFRIFTQLPTFVGFVERSDRVESVIIRTFEKKYVLVKLWRKEKIGFWGSNIWLPDMMGNLT